MDVSGYLTRLVRRAGGGAGPEGGRPLTPPRPATTEVAGDPFEAVEGPPDAEQVEAPARPHPRSEGPRSVQPRPATHRAEPPVHTVDPAAGKRPVQLRDVPRAAESSCEGDGGYETWLLELCKKGCAIADAYGEVAAMVADARALG